MTRAIGAALRREPGLSFSARTRTQLRHCSK
jgi:hypothetical protein